VDAKLMGEMYNRTDPPKKVDIMQVRHTWGYILFQMFSWSVFCSSRQQLCWLSWIAAGCRICTYIKCCDGTPMSRHV
jgi:hypothetical protein